MYIIIIIMLMIMIIICVIYARASKSQKGVVRVLDTRTIVPRCAAEDISNTGIL
jgi:hypothetical protein